MVIRDWTDYVITFDHYVVEPGKPTKVMVSVSKPAIQRYILPLGERLKLAEDIHIIFDKLRITATRDGIFGDIQVIFDVPPRESARSVDIIRSELLDKYTL